MSDPDFVYRPASAETVERMRAAARARLGIPEGCCRIYGVIVPIAYRERVRAAASKRRHKGKRAAGKAAKDEWWRIQYELREAARRNE
jgi:hypothetical protein